MATMATQMQILKVENEQILCSVCNEEVPLENTQKHPCLANSRNNVCYLQGNTIYPFNPVEAPSDTMAAQNYRDLWTMEETKQIIALYVDYSKDLGHMKRFKSHKEIYQCIAESFPPRTWEQVQNRCKTVKRRKNSVLMNRKSRVARVNPYQEVFQTSKRIDDGGESEDEQFNENLLTLSKTSLVKNKNAKTHEFELLLEAKQERHREKERNKMKRHNDKMKLLRQLVDQINVRCSVCSEVIEYPEYPARTSNSHSQGLDLSGTPGMKKNEAWTRAETEILLDLHDQYVDDVGPTKRFKRHKDMWQCIAQSIEGRTWEQVQNRLKTVGRRKRIETEEDVKSKKQKLAAIKEQERNQEKELNKQKRDEEKSDLLRILLHKI